MRQAILREQFEYLLEHFANCDHGNCLECARMSIIADMLMATFDVRDNVDHGLGVAA